MDIVSEGVRIPQEYDGIQVNFCKNPNCPNFGVPASTKKQPQGSKAEEGGRDAYTISGTGGHGGYTFVIRCNLCRETPRLKSNKAIAEETGRISSCLVEVPKSWPNEQCSNHTIDLNANRSLYQAFGKTKAGSQQYSCKLCQTTFIVEMLKSQHHMPHKNIQIFRLLVNKMLLKRICEVADISMPAMYGKIDFIHQQCLRYAASHERRLFRGMFIKRLYVAVDWQDYVVNWSQTEDKRNVVLSAVGTADNTTGYAAMCHEGEGLRPRPEGLS